MSKYDFEFDLDSRNSLSIINNMIKNNSKVLELGCAYGRLTKYLREAKNCDITVVEFDRVSGKVAARYAENSFIGASEGNIEKYIWAKKISEKFDYIIFADVLEHLYNPKKVLEKCKEFLKETGSILVSIPNIANNSVIIDLINNQFKYQEIGLLDDTHIKFFTYNSFKNMLSEIKLKVTKEFATYTRVGENEFANDYTSVSPYIARELYKREKGNAYQYIFEIKDSSIKSDFFSDINDYEYCDYEMSVFFTTDNNQNFSEHNKISVKYIPYENKNFQFSIPFDKVQFIDKLRIDPLESNVIIKINSVTVVCEGGKEQTIRCSNANSDFIMDNIYFFDINDPQFEFSVISKISMLNIDFDIIDYAMCNYNSYEIIKKYLDHKQLIINQQTEIIAQKQKYINTIHQTKVWRAYKKYRKFIEKFAKEK